MNETPSSPAPTLAGLPRGLALLLLALTVAGTLGYARLWPEAPVLSTDSRLYLDVAEDLRDGRLDRLTFRTTAYPLFLLATGSAPEPTRALFFVSLVFHFLSLWIFAGILVRCGVGTRLTGGFVLLLCLPPFVEPAAKVLTENLTQLLLLGAFALLLAARNRDRLPYFFAAGLLLGLGALVRPTFQAVGPALALAMLVTGLLSARTLPWKPRQLQAAALLAAGSLAMVLGYATWSWERFGAFGLAPGTLGYSLSTKTSKVLERLPEEYAAEREILIAGRDANLVERGSSHTGEQFLPGTKPALAEATGLEGLALEDHILHLNLILIRKAPLHYLWESLRALTTFWFPTSGALSSLGSPLLGLAWALLHFALVGLFFLELVVLTGGAILELTRRWRDGPKSLERLAGGLLPFPEAPPYLLAGGVVFYTVAISCGLHHGEARYRSPVEMLVVLMVILGARLWGKLAEERSP